MLTKEGVNDYGQQFWKLTVPDEYCNAGLEISIIATSNGIGIGGETISWDDLETAKNQIQAR